MEDRPLLQEKIRVLRAELATLEDQLQELDNKEQEAKTPAELPLRLDEYRRYGRQMILPGIGLPGQLKLKQARILVVGAGGLGCPFLLYLAGAGIGHVTIVDADTVEASNLHRQVLHSHSRIGMSKVESAKLGIKSINPLVAVHTVNDRFTCTMVADTSVLPELSSFDLMVDCTDNATTRYLLSDLAVEHNVTLVSGGAVGLEGWVGVWNLPAPAAEAKSVDKSGANGSNSQPVTTSRGPCLRCVYTQSAKDNSGNCEDDGILGPVVGTIGVLMATEAIKLLVGLHDLKPGMTLFSPISTPMFRTVKLRGRKPGCKGCGSPAKIANISPAVPNGDSFQFCGVQEEDSDERVSAKDLQEVISSGKPYVLIDTRPEVEYGICALPGSINIPHSKLLRNPELLEQAIKSDDNTYFVCRRGNDSLLDARLAKGIVTTEETCTSQIRDLRGGLQAWHRLHPEFPLY